MPPNDVLRLTVMSGPTPSFPLEKFQISVQTKKLRFSVISQYTLG
jgi:hypothetical protein